MTRPERMLPATSIARDSRVYSSTTVRHFSCCPFAHASLGLAAQRVATPLRTRLHPIRVVATLNRQKHGAYDADSDRRFGCIPKVRRAPRLAGAVLQRRLRNQRTQCAVAKECAAWIRQKTVFRSKRTRAPRQPFVCRDAADRQVAVCGSNLFRVGPPRVAILATYGTSLGCHHARKDGDFCVSLIAWSVHESLTTI